MPTDLQYAYVYGMSTWRLIWEIILLGIKPVCLESSWLSGLSVTLGQTGQSIKSTKIGQSINIIDTAGITLYWDSIWEFILDNNILCIRSHISSIYMLHTHVDKMWFEYTMYSSMYNNNLYFKYKCSQYASQYIKCGHAIQIIFIRHVTQIKEWLYMSHGV